MSAARNDGGPAFPLASKWENDSDVMIVGPNGAPVPPGFSETIIASGMTLRDYFAAKAMQGLLAHPHCKPVGPNFTETTNCVATEAYAVADAMIAARGQ